MKFVGCNGKNVFLEVFDNDFVEEATAHDEIGLGGSIFFGEDKKGLGREGPS